MRVMLVFEKESWLGWRIRNKRYYWEEFGVYKQVAWV